MRMVARDKRALIGGSLAATALMAYLLWPSGEASQSSVELVPAGPQPPVTAPSPPPPVRVETGSVAVPTGLSIPAPSPGAVPEGLTLTGIAGSGAIFALANGEQFFVARGRDVMPGLRLQVLGLRHVELGSSNTTFRMGLGGAAYPAPAPGGPIIHAPTATGMPAAQGAPRPYAADANQSPLPIGGNAPPPGAPR